MGAGAPGRAAYSRGPGAPCGLGAAHLFRRFVAETGIAPLRWVTAARVREARRLLEVSDLPVEDVAARTGLGSAANLRLHLARDAGITPTAYRAAYQGRRPDAQVLPGAH